MIAFRISPRFACILGIFSLLAANRLDAQEVQWRTDYAAARREAREKNLPVFMDFGTANCTWCKKLDVTTFRDPAIVKLLNEQFIPIKIDADRSKDLTHALEIKSFPTLVFATPEGRIIGVNEGFVDAAKFGQQLRRAQSDTAQSTSKAPMSAGQVAVTGPGAPAVRVTVPPTEPAANANVPLPPFGDERSLAAKSKADPEEARKLSEQLANLYLSLAESAMSENQPQQAAAYLQRVLQVCPDSPCAQTAQQQLVQLGKPAAPTVRAQSQ